MAGKAFGIVSRGLSLHLTMRIVASRATDASVRRVVAFAVGQPVGLEPDVANIARPFQRDLRPRAMAAPAGVRHFLYCELRQLGHRCARGNVRASRTVTVLA